MKLVISTNEAPVIKSILFCSKCTKTHLQPYEIFQIHLGRIPGPADFKGKEEEIRQLKGRGKGKWTDGEDRGRGAEGGWEEM
jgi:hypothetical protein